MRFFALVTLLLLPPLMRSEIRSLDSRAAAVHPVSAQDESTQGSALPSGYTDASYLGVAVCALDDGMTSELRLQSGQGALVRWVAKGSPAAKAGIRPNDIILQFAGQDINDVSDLGRLVREIAPGHKAKLKIIRDGKVIPSSVTLAALRTPSTPSAGNSIRLDLAAPDFFTSDMPLPALLWRSNILGIEYESIDAQLATYFGVKQGLLVRYVLERSAAQTAGLRAGDVLVKVQSRQCTNPRDLGTAIHISAQTGKPIALGIVRDGKPRTLELKLTDTPNQTLPE